MNVQQSCSEAAAICDDTELKQTPYMSGSQRGCLSSVVKPTLMPFGPNNPSRVIYRCCSMQRLANKKLMNEDLSFLL